MVSRTFRRSLASLALALALAGCATLAPPPPAACAAPGQPAVLAELLFGLHVRGNATVAPSEFEAFVAAQISPRFPAGLTVLPGSGEWQTPEGARVAEASRMVVIAAPDTPQTAERLHAIRAAYRVRFAQRSVGLITIQSCASF